LPSCGDLPIRRARQELAKADRDRAAVELVNLVLMADGAQAVRLLASRVAVDILIADPDAPMTLDLVVDAGQRDAAFPMQDHLG
jgi:hypothetical protein